MNAATLKHAIIDNVVEQKREIQFAKMICSESNESMLSVERIVIRTYMLYASKIDVDGTFQDNTTKSTVAFQ